MAPENEEPISLNLMISKRNDRVVFAESDADFVNILLSFLTMPMGTIVRLLNNETCPPTIGSFTNLYRGVQKLNAEYLSTEACHEVLLAPKNTAEIVLQEMKLNIDNTGPTRSFVCSVCPHLSNFVKYTRCDCGLIMSRKLKPRFHHLSPVGVGLVRPGVKFNIIDDLQVTPASYHSIPILLQKHGICDFKALYSKKGLEETRCLLKLCLVSRSTLTDMFLRDKCVTTKQTLLKQARFKTESGTSSNSGHMMSIRIIFQKADNKILFAEASEDFVDLLFSFLTFPIGLVSNLLGGNTSVKCIDNLYKSVSSVERFIGSNQLKEALVSPKLPPCYVTKNQLLLDVREVDRDSIFFKDLCYLGIRHISVDSHDSYVKGPATFIVKDNLVVKPFSTISSIRLLSSLNAGVDLFENQVISVG